MRPYRLLALVTFDPAAPETQLRGYLDGTRTLCVVESSDGLFFPAVSAGWQPPPAAQAAINVLLSEAEAACFAPCDAFTIWADAMVGGTTWGVGLVAQGVVSRLELPAPLVDDSSRVHPGPADPIPSPPVRDRVASLAGLAR
jgi:hypothetical protein